MLAFYTNHPAGWWAGTRHSHDAVTLNSRARLKPATQRDEFTNNHYLLLVSEERGHALLIGYILAVIIMAFYWEYYFSPILRL